MTLLLSKWSQRVPARQHHIPTCCAFWSLLVAIGFVFVSRSAFRCRSIQTNRRTGRSLVLTFYGIPLEPGRSRVITAFFTNAKVSLGPLLQALFCVQGL